MGGEWGSQKVAELQKHGALLVEDGNHGEYRPRRDEFSSDGIAFVRAADMTQGRVLFESASKINDIAFRRIRKGVGASGDVLLSHKGTVGKVALVPDESPPFVCSPQTTFWRVLKPNIIARGYLYAYMRSSHFSRQLQSRQNETDMAAYVSLTAQRDLTIPLPPIEEQQTIAHILGSLDDKIELNRRMNRTLEQMAQVIFKSWFIDFYPVVYNAVRAGNPVPARFERVAACYRENPDALKLPRDILKLFPDRFEGSELGEVPAGWSLRQLDEFFPVKTGKKDANFSTEDGIYPFFTCSVKQDKFSPEYSFDGAAILLAGNGDFNVKWYRGKFEAYQRTYVLMPFDERLLAPLFYLMQHCLDDLTVGYKGSVINYLTKGMITNYRRPLPENNSLIELSRTLSDIQEKQECLKAETEKLVALRETLLPKLVSGELRISDLGKRADQVA